MNDAINQFKQAMLAAGLTPPDAIEPGVFFRFPGVGKGQSNTAAWGILFDDLRGGSFGDYSSGLESNWQAHTSKPYSESERRTNNQLIQAAKTERESKRAQLQADAAAEAEERFKAASNCTSHPYLIHKGVKAYGIKTESDGTLLIPRRDSGILCNVERIDSSDFANKKGLFGGRRAGCYHSVSYTHLDVYKRQGFTPCT